MNWLQLRNPFTAAAITLALAAPSTTFAYDEEKPSEAPSTQVASARGANPSFDCAKAGSEVEKLICKDAELADLDRSLADLYAVLLKNTPTSERQMLRAEQRGWVKGRDDCWKDDDMRGCVAGEYRSRIDELKDR
ncbi:MAG: lysozyme inhibitor LprI family protein [Pseudomonadota bacterium]|nr:lysozyme inhibitor LprI family protein [Pseudomonadota bacterium]